jgi:F-type H+-transporting ATPase subunit epsilon
MAIGGKITLHIVTPDQSYSHEVDEVSLPGAEGDFGVLPGHTPFFTSLRTGQMWYRQGTEKHYLAVSVGFVEVLPNSVSVLSQVAQRAEDLDQAKAEAGMKRAEEMMGSFAHEMDFERARLALLRTLQQLQAESRRGAGHGHV